MKRLMKSLVYFSLITSALAASADEYYTITPVSQNQVLLNRVVKTDNGYNIAESYPAFVSGPWNAQTAQLPLTTSQMVAEQLKTINHPKPTGFSPHKESALLEAAQDYSFYVKITNPCMLDMSREDCVYDEHMYTVLYNHTFNFK